MGITTQKLLLSYLADNVNGQTDGQTDDGEFNSPPSSLLEAGDNYNKNLDKFIRAAYHKKKSAHTLKFFCCKQETN